MRENFVKARGKNIFYLEEGEGRPVVLIHGNTGCGLWYSRAMDIPGLHCFAPDIPNFGRSDRLESADIDLYADHMEAFIRELRIDKPVVAGHSLGGAVAISLALRNPDLVKSLLLIDTCPLSGLVTPEAYYPVIEQYITNRALLKQALKTVTPRLNDEGFLDLLVDQALLMNPIAFSGNARALARFDYEGRGNMFIGRVLVIRGTEDVLITQDMAEKTVQSFPNASLEVLEGVGHSVMVEDPPRFKAVLAGFANT